MLFLVLFSSLVFCQPSSASPNTPCTSFACSVSYLEWRVNKDRLVQLSTRVYETLATPACRCCYAFVWPHAIQIIGFFFLPRLHIKLLLIVATARSQILTPILTSTATHLRTYGCPRPPTCINLQRRDSSTGSEAGWVSIKTTSTIFKSARGP